MSCRRGSVDVADAKVLLMFYVAKVAFESLKLSKVFCPSTREFVLPVKRSKETLNVYK